MSEFLFQYVPVHPITWVYLSSLLMVGLFFKFGRFWSVRNLDLVLLILLSPGLLLVHFGGAMIKQEQNESASAPLADSGAGSGESGDASIDTADVPIAVGAPTGAASNAEVSPPTDLPAPPLAPKDAKEITPVDDFTVLAESADEPAPQPEASPLRGRAIQYLGFVWLFGACGLFLIRLLLDPTMVRRPLLEPNLSPGGLTFIGCSLFVFLMANVVNSQVAEDDLAGPRSADQLLSGVADQEGERIRVGTVPAMRSCTSCPAWPPYRSTGAMFPMRKASYGTSGSPRRWRFFPTWRSCSGSWPSAIGTSRTSAWESGRPLCT